jgi:hypothetical protein
MRTIKPGRYLVMPGVGRPPHIQLDMHGRVSRLEWDSVLMAA